MTDSPFAGVPRKPQPPQDLVDGVEITSEPTENTIAEDEIEIIELQDEDGKIQKLAILNEFEFEERKFAVLTPFEDLEKVEEAIILLFEISKDDPDLFQQVEDDDLLERITTFLTT